MKLTGVAAGMLAVVALAGCSSGSSSTHSTTHSATKQERVEFYRSLAKGAGVTMTDADLTTFGKAVCAMRNAGDTRDAIATRLVNEQTTTTYNATQVAVLVGGAEQAYCPDVSG